MLNEQDMQDIFEQFQQGVPMLQIVREYGIANPPMIEQYCSTLPEQEQKPMLKALVIAEAERIAVCGIETFEQLNEFLGVIECCCSLQVISDRDLDTVLYAAIRWITAYRNGKQLEQDEAEAALKRMASGLSHRIF